MSPESRQLIRAARRERERLGRMVQYATTESWEKMSEAAGWWNRDVMAHLLAQDYAAAQLLANEPAAEIDEYRGRLGAGEAFTVDGFNDFVVNRRVQLPTRQILGDWGTAADLLLRRASALSEEDWRTRRVPWLAGEIGVKYLLQSRIVEWWMHGEDMRPAADLPPAIEHEPLYVTNDLAIRMLPYALGLAGLSFPGRSVLIQLNGAGGGTWHWGLSAREAPGGNEKPDAVIEGRGYCFARVAARRVPAEEYLGSGDLVIGGNEILAETVLRHVRAFA